MAENTPAGFPDAAKNNQDVSTQLLNQDLNKLPLETEPASDALDKLAAAAAAAPESKVTTSETPPVVEPKKEEAAPPVVTPPADDPAAVEAARVAAERSKYVEQADKLFKDSPNLPPNASPKSAEAFTSVKVKAAQEISAREAEIEKLRKENAKFAEKLKTPIPPEVESELKEHREWRAKLDVDSDPKFKEFDKTITAAQDFIYAQLKKSPVVTADVLAEIKKYGGPENVNLTKLFDSVKDPVLQRIVEAKVADIEMAKYNKNQAIEAAKTNISQYVADQGKARAAAVGQHNTITQQRLDPMLKQLDWLVEKPVDDKAEPAVKKALQEQNEFVKQTRDQVAAALQDDSPEMRAILLTGMAQLFNLQRSSAADKKELEATKAALADITAKYEKVKNASTSRLRESGASTNGATRVAKPEDSVNIRAQDALDTIAKQVLEQRAAAGTRV